MTKGGEEEEEQRIAHTGYEVQKMGRCGEVETQDLSAQQLGKMEVAIGGKWLA